MGWPMASGHTGFVLFFLFFFRKIVIWFDIIRTAEEAERGEKKWETY